ncbi:MAG: VCBS repeat-containing protein, partial [Myxococcota bacterium]
VLPGRNGIEPRISLTVGGRAPSEYGQGVTINGQSAISRCARTVFSHGRATPVVYDETDAFCLDGQPLLDWHENSCEIGVRELRPRTDSRTKVCVLADGTDGPRNFAVFRQSGEIHYYGMEAGERVRMPQGFGDRVWHLSTVVDRFGNGRSYEYTDIDNSSGNVFLGLELITYSEHYSNRFPVAGFLDLSEPGTRSVRFIRRPANETWTHGYIEGHPYAVDSLVEAIEISGPGPDSELSSRTVVLTHDESGPLPVLSQISLRPGVFGANSVAAASPITFEYHPRTDFSVVQEGEGIGESVSRLDINGDGYPEYVTTVAGDHDIDGASGSVPTMETVSLSFRYEMGNGPGNAHPLSGPLEFDATSWLLADVNGDSKADIVRCHPDGLFHQLGVGNGTFGASELVHGDCLELVPGTADLNADGYVDYLALVSQDSVSATALAVFGAFGSLDTRFLTVNHFGAPGFDLTESNYGDVTFDGADELVLSDGTTISCRGEGAALGCITF